MPSPTQAVPLLRADHPDGRVGGGINHSSESGPAIVSLACLEAERLGPEGTSIVRCRRAVMDVTGPSSVPRGVEDLDLSDLVDLHKELEREQERGPSELVIHGKVSGLAATMVVDTGASVSCMSTSL